MKLSKKEKYTAYFLTLIQYSGIIVFAYISPWIAEKWYLLIIEFIGIGIGIAAIFNMLKSKLRITPIPDKNAIHIKSGLYKYVRHPMYLALLLTFTPLLISFYNPILLIVYAIFTINLLFKLKFEEKLLIKKFPTYKDYIQETKMLIPFII